MSNQVIPMISRGGSPSITFAEMEHLAERMAASKLFGVKDKDAMLSLMAIAHAEGRHPAVAARDYDIIQGKGAKKAEAMLRDFIESGGKVEWHKLDDTMADATFSHPSGGSVRITWDLERAKTAGLAGKDMYKKFPRQMLRSRTVSEGVRTVCPMATSGMYVPEEISDFAPSVNSTPPAAPKLVPPPAPTTELSEADERALDRQAERNGRGETVEADFEEAEEPHRIPNEAKTPVEWGTELVAKFKASTNLADLMAWMDANAKVIDLLGQKASSSIQKAYDARYAEIVATMGPSPVPLLEGE